MPHGADLTALCLIRHHPRAVQLPSRMRLKTTRALAILQALTSFSTFIHTQSYSVADFVRQALVGIRKNYDGFTLECSDSEVKTKSVILCMGATHKKLGIDGENKFEGRGVSYCAVCDGYFFKDKTVAVIGGGNTAVTRGNLSFSYMQTGFSYLQGRRIESRQSACAKA